MARYPAAAWRPLPEATREPLITATQVILHTAVSGAASLYGHFSRDDVDLESHFYVYQTAVEQYVDTGRQADANRTANIRAISIETWDDGNPALVGWTPVQMDRLVELVAWLCRTHGIPARLCAAHDASGIGWHVMFGAPGPWTPVAKSCPGGREEYEAIHGCGAADACTRILDKMGAACPVDGFSTGKWEDISPPGEYIAIRSK